jgi:glycosyltransferase involved in cell wall biosynthesis
MWVVAYLWNTNGMASWCWEAAHALAEQGEPVLLVCCRSAQLPGPTDIPVLRFDAPQADVGTAGKIARELRRLSTRPDGFLPALHAELLRTGRQPTAYLLNSTAFVHPAVPTPQFVVGWAFPTSLPGYVRKIPVYCPPAPTREFARTLLDTIGWYRKDWYAYRSASGVLSVSGRLDGALRSRGVRSSVVHPGTAVASVEPNGRAPGAYRLLLAAADLDDPRKRVGWMIDALAAGERRDFELLCVGRASDALRDRAARSGLSARFIGPVSRDDLQKRMREQDLFLFGSRLDDWGYILVEAMSQGLAVIAPRLSPFDEIVGDDAGLTYDPFDPGSFRRSVYAAAGPALGQLRTAAAARAAGRFSRAAFAKALLAAARTAPSSN